jgi:MFS superfamily sulfate permease-like transporter
LPFGHVVVGGRAGGDHRDLANGDPQLRATLAVGLVLVTGGLFLLAGIFRFGSVTSFIAKPVLRSFAFGLALTIILKQVASVVGVHPDRRQSGALRPAIARTTAAMELAGGRCRCGGAAVVEPVLPVSTGARRFAGGGDRHRRRAVAEPVGPRGEDDRTIDLSLEVPNLPVLPFADWLRLGEVAFALVMILYAESYGSISASPSNMVTV